MATVDLATRRFLSATPLSESASALEVKDGELWISQTAVLIKGISHERCVSVYKTETEADASFVTA